MMNTSEFKEWYDDKNNDSCYFASAVTLYRNFEDINFMNRLNAKEAGLVLETVRQSLSSEDRYDFTELNDCFNDKFPFYDKMRFTEEWKFTKEFVDSKIPHGFVTDGKNLFVTVNDREHLNISSYYVGNNLRKAYETSVEFANIKNLKKYYAFSNEFGYVTSDPQYMGTGLYGEIILHVPAICITGAFEQFNNIMSNRNIEVKKPFPGTESKYTGLIKISNSQTLGTDDKSIIDNLCEAAEQAVMLEKVQEGEILRANYGNLEDMVWRALGTLKYARSITFKEAVRMISLVYFGIETEIINNVKPFSPASLIFSLRIAGLSRALGRVIESVRVNEARAEYLRKFFTE